MALRYYLDDTLFNEPADFTELLIRITRVKDLKGLFESFSSSLTFTGEAYDYINRFIEDLNLCRDIDIRIEDMTGNIVTVLFEGIISIKDCSKKFDQKTIKATVKQKSFDAIIDKNKSQKFFVNVGKSLNGLDITKPTQYTLDMFAPSTGSYTKANVPFFKVEEVMQFLVAAMTDGKVGFQSDYLSTSTNWTHSLIAAGDTFVMPNLYLTKGKNCRSGILERVPELSFVDLDREINKIANTGMRIEQVNGSPILRYENAEYFFDTTIQKEFRNVKDALYSIDKSKLYSHVKIGNTRWLRGLTYNNDVQLEVFKEEHYNMICGEDIELNMLTDYRTDSNVIENIVVNGDTTDDDEIVLVVGDEMANNGGGGPGEVIRYQTTAPAYFYNAPLRNGEIFDRYLKALPNSVTKYVDESSTLFRASPSGTWNGYTITPPDVTILVNGVTGGVKFNDDSTGDNFDTGGNFDTSFGFYKYNVPSGGNYTFETELVLKVTGTARLTAKIVRGASNSFPIETITETVDASSDVNIKVQGNFDCNTGDRIYVQLLIQRLSPTTVTVSITNDSYFACTGSDLDGGTRKIFDIKDYRAQKINFETNMGFSDFNNLRNFANRKVIFNEGSNPNNDKEAWIQRIEYNVIKSTAKINLIL